MLKRPANSYTEYMRRSLVPLTTSRVMPYCGITFLLALAAHNRAGDVAFIAYVLAIFSVLSVVTSMSLGATGNLIAEYSGNALEKSLLFQGGFGVALVMALVALLVSSVLVSVVIYLPGAQMDISKIRSLAIIYFVGADTTSIHFYLQLQSAGLFIGFVALQLRIRNRHAKAGAIATEVFLDK